MRNQDWQLTLGLSQPPCFFLSLYTLKEEAEVIARSVQFSDRRKEDLIRIASSRRKHQ
jgi:hypothetical protein